MKIFSRKKKWLLVLGGIVLVYALIGFFGIPYFIKSKVLPDLSTKLQRPILVRDVAFNPFAFTFQIQGFEIREGNQTPLVGFEELFINFELSSLFRRSYTFDEIRLKIPFGLIRILPGGALNVAALSPPDSPKDGKEPEKKLEEGKEKKDVIPPIDIALLAIEQGAIEFHDESLPTPFSADIVPIQFSLKNFSTREKDNVHSLKAEFGEGEVLSWEGTLTLDPFQSQGNVSLNQIGLRTIWQYVQDRVKFEIPQGVGTVSARYSVEAPDQGMDVNITEGNVLIKDVVLKEKNGSQNLITLPVFEVANVTVDVPKRQVRIGSVQSQGAQFVGWLNKDGSVNFQSLFGAGTESGQQVDASNGSPSYEETNSPWDVSVKTVGVENYSAEFEDRTLEVPVPMAVSAFDISLSDITLPPKGPVAFSTSLMLNSSGTIQTKGSFMLEPPSADVNLNISGIGLKPFEPYLDRFARMDIAGGEVNLQGKVQYHGAPEGQTLLHYVGAFGVNKLALRDPQRREDFLAWDALAFNGVAVDVEPTAIHIDEVVLEKIASTLAKGSDGTMNVSRILSPPTASDSKPGKVEEAEVATGPAQEKSGESVPVTIDAVRFVDGSAQFVDQSIVPNVVTGIQNFTGVIKGLSSKERTKAALALKGKIDKFAPFEIKGNINPLTKDLYTKLAISLKGMNLGPASPYSGKYAGYPIQKGKLSLDLHYSIAEQHLVGENKILIDQFTFGKETNSPQATSLPVPFAVALLKDRKGLIDIDLPVRGDLNSPEFSYGGLILQALVNLITKVATSPFAALGNLVGGSGEELQYVEFSPGGVELPEPEIKKLTTLAKALEERPGLRLAITGAADSGGDRTALAEEKLLTELRKEKEKEPPSSSESTQQGTAVENKDMDEDPKLLRRLYVKKFGNEPLKEPKGLNTEPRSGSNVSSIVEGETSGASGSNREQHQQKKEPLSPEEIKLALIESIDVTEAELQTLAKERASRIQEQLVQQGKIEEQRLFQADVQIDPPSDAQLIRSPLSLSP